LNLCYIKSIPWDIYPLSQHLALPVHPRRIEKFPTPTIFILWPSADLTPKNVESTPANNRLCRRLRIRIRNINEMTDRNLRKRDDLRLLPKFVAKVENGEDRDVDVRRNERLVTPVSLDENRISTSQQKDKERG